MVTKSQKPIPGNGGVEALGTAVAPAPLTNSIGETCLRDFIGNVDVWTGQREFLAASAIIRRPMRSTYRLIDPREHAGSWRRLHGSRNAKLGTCDGNPARRRDADRPESPDRSPQGCGWDTDARACALALRRVSSGCRHPSHAPELRHNLSTSQRPCRTLSDQALCI